MFFKNILRKTRQPLPDFPFFRRNLTLGSPFFFLVEKNLKGEEDFAVASEPAASCDINWENHFSDQETLP
jgi:hypothetical protein